MGANLCRGSPSQKTVPQTDQQERIQLYVKAKRKYSQEIDLLQISLKEWMNEKIDVDEGILIIEELDEMLIKVDKAWKEVEDKRDDYLDASNQASDETETWGRSTTGDRTYNDERKNKNRNTRDAKKLL